MNPELEQRLRSGLSNEANALPGHDGSPQGAMAAGRRRQTTRRVGTGLAAVALFVGGGTIYAQNQPSDPVDVVVADDGRATVTSPVQDSNEAGDTADVDRRDLPVDSSADAPVGRDPVAMAVGSEVIVVAADGELDIRWSAPAGVQLVAAQAAGHNGVVIETSEQILWLPTGASPLEATVLKTEDQNLFLHDVARVDRQWSAIWSEAPIDWESEEFKGSSRLVAQNVQTGVETEIESYSWLGEGDDWKYYADATPLFENGPMAIVRSYNQGACHWIDPIAPGGVMSAIATPLPRPEDPAGNCTNPIITDIISGSNGGDGPSLAYVTGDFFNENVLVNALDKDRNPVTYEVDRLHSLLDYHDGRLRWAELTTMDDGSDSLVIIEADVNLGPFGAREVWRTGLAGGRAVETPPRVADPLPNDLPDDMAAPFEPPPAPPSTAPATTPAPPAPPVVADRSPEMAALDWKAFLRTVPELRRDPGLEQSGDYYPKVSDYYEVLDGRTYGYPVFDAILDGDLDGDGLAEVVIPLDSGGTGGGTGVLVFTQTDEGPKLVGPETFYDRTSQKVWPSITGGQLQINSSVGADWEPSCCLSGQRTTTWDMRGGRLVLTDFAEIGVPEARGPVVERFYDFLAGGEFDNAYAMLSPAQQAREPFTSWKAGFANTREIEVDVTDIGTDDTVEFDLAAVDEAADGAMTQSRYRGSWQLEYSFERHQWLLDSFSVEKISGEEAAAQQPAGTEDSRVGFGSWGKVRVGMTEPELATLDLGYFFEDDYISEGCRFAYVPNSDSMPSLMLVDDELARISFNDPGDRGPKGLGSASTEADILATYPNAVVTPHPYGFGPDDDAHYIEIIDPDGSGYSFIFETDGTDVKDFRTGDININRWIEGCA